MSANGGSGSTCDAEVEEHVPPGAEHELECTPISYATNPPSGGNHYGTWSAFRTYDYPVPSGFIVHDLEHGAVVLWYNCPEGCPGEVAQAQAFIDALPEDPLCSGYASTRRITMLPYPELTVRWAASAWGWTLRASCFDARAFEDFYLAHFGNAPEDFCASGSVIIENACP